MNLFTIDIKNQTSELIKKNCTVGKAFVYIDNWCKENNAYYNIEDMWLDTNGAGTRAKINVKCIYNDTKSKIANIFEIKYE